MDLRKFPVTAPDGTEYRVSIEEYLGGFCAQSCASVKLYVRRKRFGFRKVYGRAYDDGGGVYDRHYPDYITLAAQAVRDYYEDMRIHAEYLRVVNTRGIGKQAAIDQFNAWDGHIDPKGANV